MALVCTGLSVFALHETRDLPAKAGLVAGDAARSMVNEEGDTAAEAVWSLRLPREIVRPVVACCFAGLTLNFTTAYALAQPSEWRNRTTCT